MNNNISNRFIIPLIDSESYFQLIRSNFLNRPTVTEFQTAARIAKVTDYNNNNNSHDITDTSSSSLVSIKQKQNSKWDTKLIIHYTHEKRLQTLKKDIHQ
jgi:hypothetical protein